jgi:sarcosine oxidase subunit gamma
MPEFQRISALAGVAKPGRYGADKGAPGITLSVRHPLSIVTVIARKGKSKALGDALKKQSGIEVRWAGPDQYFVIGDGALYADLKKNLAGLASVSDQSHGRIVIRIEGPKARAVLAKGTPVDLHASDFPTGKSALSQMAHVGVHLTRVDEDTFELSLFRGFAESFWEWLTLMSEEFGYQVT